MGNVLRFMLNKEYVTSFLFACIVDDEWDHLQRLLSSSTCRHGWYKGTISVHSTGKHSTQTLATVQLAVLVFTLRVCIVIIMQSSSPVSQRIAVPFNIPLDRLLSMDAVSRLQPNPPVPNIILCVCALSSYCSPFLLCESTDCSPFNRSSVRCSPRVHLAAYSRPHPSHTFINLRVQTTGQVSAAEVLQSASSNVGQVCEHLSSVFTTAMQEFEAQEGHGSLDPADKADSHSESDSAQTDSTGSDEMDD